MRIAVLGTGAVGRTIGSRLVLLGHEVAMGSRTADNPSATEWARQNGSAARAATFADAAAFGELVVHATAGGTALQVIGAASAANLAGKVLLDVSNPLDFSAGMPPSLKPVNTDSLGEQIQRACPDARVVKALNTMNATIMVDPTRVPGQHTVFVSGNDDAAKRSVTGLLTEFGWSPVSIIDLGDISTARGTEMLLPLWLRLYGALGHTDFNFHIQRAG